jgi:cell division protein FtsB
MLSRMAGLTAIRRRFADPISCLPEVEVVDAIADATRHKVFRSSRPGINASLTKTAQPYEGVAAGWPQHRTLLEPTAMSVESLTYIDLADRLGTTAEAARSLVRRLRLSRHTGNDGKVRVTIDLSDIQYKRLPGRSPAGHRADIEALSARIQMLQAELARLEVENSCIQASAAGHRADFERERDRSDTIMSEALRLTKVAMSAREIAARLEGELAVRQTRPWWKKLAG